MKAKSRNKNNLANRLPVSFSINKISEEKINSHWEKINSAIAQAEQIKEIPRNKK